PLVALAGNLGVPRLTFSGSPPYTDPRMRNCIMSPFVAPLFLLALFGAAPPRVLEPIPDRLVVLTFDDSCKSHYTVARPVLKKYGFSATFFITEGFDFKTNKRDYMSWEEIAQLHKDGFEIGNHTRDHKPVTDKTVKELPEQVRTLAEQCKKHGIPAPV